MLGGIHVNTSPIPPAALLAFHAVTGDANITGAITAASLAAGTSVTAPAVTATSALVSQGSLAAGTAALNDTTVSGSLIVTGAWQAVAVWLPGQGHSMPAASLMRHGMLLRHACCLTAVHLPCAWLAGSTSTGSLSCSAAASVTGQLSAGSLQVSGASALQGGASVTGNLAATGTVSGAALAASTGPSSLAGGVSVTGGLNVSAAAAVGSLSVQGASTLQGATTITAPTVSNCGFGEGRDALPTRLPAGCLPDCAWLAGCILPATPPSPPPTPTVPADDHGGRQCQRARSHPDWRQQHRPNRRPRSAQGKAAGWWVCERACRLDCTCLRAHRLAVPQWQHGMHTQLPIHLAMPCMLCR